MSPDELARYLFCINQGLDPSLPVPESRLSWEDRKAFSNPAHPFYDLMYQEMRQEFEDKAQSMRKA